MPAAISAAATLSAAPAVTVLPSTDRVTARKFSSGNRWNIEPPRREDREFIAQAAGGQHGCKNERMVGGEGDAAVTGGDEGARAFGGLLVDREAVLGHHPQGRPDAHDVDAAHERKHPA